MKNEYYLKAQITEVSIAIDTPEDLKNIDQYL